jgi:hypothetical protein
VTWSDSKGDKRTDEATASWFFKLIFTAFVALKG